MFRCFRDCVVTRPSARIFLLASATAGALITGCGSEDSGGGEASPPSVKVNSVEVVRGIPSQGRDPAVVAIDINGEALCSGTLIAPSLVLTARHCVSTTIDEVSCPTDQRQIRGDRPPETLRILVGDEVSSARRVARGRDLVVPPNFQLCDADIALIVLDNPVDGIDPVPIGDRAIGKGDHVRAVGFGRAVDGSNAGTKLYREHVRVVDTSASEFLVGEATCQGDSGGPAFDEETGAVAGVVSRGGPSCEGRGVHNVYTRTDAFRELVDAAIAQANGPANDSASPPPDPAEHPRKKRGPAKPSRKAPKAKKPKSDVGSACTKAEECAAGMCIRDGERQYCSRSCGKGDKCPSGSRCKKAPEGGSVCMAH